MAIKIPIITEFNQKGIRDAKNTLANFGKTAGVAFAAVGAAAAVAGAGILRFSNDSIKAASTLSESLNAVNVAYGAASESIVKLGEDSAQRLGVTQSAFNEAAVRFSAFAERVVGTGGDVSKFVGDITTRAADFASVFNIDVAEALQVFQSGLSGEAEPLKRFGINLLDSEVKAYALRTGLIKVGQTMTEQQKVQARYGLLMEATNKTAGDFANTSGGLANQQRILTASFEQLQAEVGTALLPVIAEATGEFTKMIPTLKDALIPIAENLAGVFRTRVLPAIQDFTKWLASPAGTERVNELANAFIDVIESLVDFAIYVVDNFEEIKNQIIVITTVTTAIYGLRVALQLATIAQLAFNTAVLKNPYVLAAVAVGTLVGGLFALDDALFGATAKQNKANEAAKGFTGRIAELVAEEKRLQLLLGDGSIGYAQYKEMVGKVRSELATLQGQMMRAAGAGNYLNAITLKQFRGQLGDTRVEAEKLVNAQRQLFLAMGGKITAAMTGAGAGGGGGGGGGAGESEADKTAAARKRVQDLIKSTRKQVIEAQSDYRKAVAKANADFLSNEVRIQKEYAVKFADIINQSKNRIRDAFRSVASLTVATFLGDFRQVEEARQRSFEDAKKVATDLGKAFTEVFIAGDPVQAYLDSLRNKVAANQKILQVSAKLLENGFSQTFIEQIIATGADGGLALAEGILSSNPQVISEIKTLFKDIERVSETGANALADQLYEQQGLATRELNTLYEKTQSDLLDALAANYTQYTDTLADAANALRESMTDITSDFNDAIDDMEGDLGGLSATVAAFRAMLGGVAGSTIEAVKPLAPSSSNRTAGGGGFVFDIDKALGQAPGTYASTNNKPQTVINVNVSTDATQSNAMVGKAIDTVIKTYTRTGGGGGGGPQVAV